MLMTPCDHSTRKDAHIRIGRRWIKQHHTPRNFAAEIEIAIEHSFDFGMQPATVEEIGLLRNLAVM